MATLLFIHGFPFDHSLWSHAAGALSREHRVIAPDLPGFGGAPPLPIDPAAARVEDFARFLLARIDRERIDRFAPVGHSMGGYVALALQRLAPERLTGFALVSSRATADGSDARAKRGESAARMLRDGIGFLADEMSRKPLAPDPDPALVASLRAMILRAAPKGVAAALHSMAERPDATAQLARITVPALVVAGQKDPIVPPAESEALARGFPDGELVWCERSGHVPMLEEPELVADALARFARDLDG